MANLKPTEILLIILVVLLLFGAKRLPDLAKSVGKSLRILKAEVKDLDENDGRSPTVGTSSSARSDIEPVDEKSVPASASTTHSSVDHR